MQKKRIFLGALLLLLSTSIGCASRGINVSKNGVVSIERVPSKNIFIPWADVYQDGNNLTITGVVEQRSASTIFLETKIDTVVIDKEGNVLKEAKSRDIYVPRKIPGKGIKWEHFELTMGILVPQDSKVRLVCNNDETE